MLAESDLKEARSELIYRKNLEAGKRNFVGNKGKNNGKDSMIILKGLTDDVKMIESGIKSAISEAASTGSLAKDHESSKENCTICMTALDSDLAMLPCGQLFHKDCITTWFRRAEKCPICKRKSKIADIQYPNLEKNNGAYSRSGNSNLMRVNSVELQGEWGTKVDALCSDIIEFLRRGNEKAIVFSQWPEVIVTCMIKLNLH